MPLNRSKLNSWRPFEAGRELKRWLSGSTHSPADLQFALGTLQRRRENMRHLFEYTWAGSAIVVSVAALGAAMDSLPVLIYGLSAVAAITLIGLGAFLYGARLDDRIQEVWVLITAEPEVRPVTRALRKFWVFVGLRG